MALMIAICSKNGEY